MRGNPCLDCGAPMTASREDRPHAGLPGVVLRNVRVYRCSACGSFEVEIPRIDELHGLIAKHLLAKRSRLLGPEVRFLRNQLGISGAELARRMGVDPATVSRWENDKDGIGAVADRLLRLMVARDLAPESLASIGERQAPLKLMMHVGSRGWRAAA